jgi:2,3-bisphosphoglycerate-independent phosphoglycerate mutase
MAQPVVLIVLDGWGVTPKQAGNPIMETPTPFIDLLTKHYPYTTLNASGNDVGLPHNQSGNSEAGHTTIGAGRRVEQDSYVISRSISNGTFFQNPAFVGAYEHTRHNSSNLHIMGILSGMQSPHMDPDHLLALFVFIRQNKFKKVYVHLFTDGRDSYYYSGIERIQQLKKLCGKNVEIVTIIGRLYLDRKKNWTRTRNAYEALTCGKGNKVRDLEKGVTSAYTQGQTDEFISPLILSDTKGKARGRIEDDDAVIFFNLRSDRARQLTKIFIQKDFERRNNTTFGEGRHLHNLYFVAMTDFGPDLPGLVTAFPSQKTIDTLPFVLKAKRQLYIAESEKYAHMTYFFNGGFGKPVAGEGRLFFKSPHTDSYARTPGMRVPDISQAVCTALPKKDFIAANFASPDMIGHTGNPIAAGQAIAIVDHQLEKIAHAVDRLHGTLVITADHGNIEEIIDASSHNIDTRHSHYPVPFYIYGDTFKGKKFKKFRKRTLADVAPTLISIMKMKQPNVMTGRSLI